MPTMTDNGLRHVLRRPSRDAGSPAEVEVLLVEEIVSVEITRAYLGLLEHDASIGCGSRRRAEDFSGWVAALAGLSLGTIDTITVAQ